MSTGDFPVGSEDWKREWQREHERVGKPTLTAAWDEAKNRGLGSRSFVDAFGALDSLLVDKKQDEFDSIDAMAGGALGRIIEAGKSGIPANADDVERLHVLHDIAMREAEKESGNA